MPQLNITSLDVSILITYVLGTRILFGWYAARKMRGGDSEAYFLGGRNIPWFMIGLSFYVSNMSGSTFVGLPGSGYHNGIAVYHYEWLPAVILVFFVLFMLPPYLASRVYTAPQFLERRYDRRSKVLFSAFLMLANIFIDAAAALYAGAMVMQVLFPQIPFWITVSLAAAIAGVYILFGGLEAVVLNDTVQATVILAGGTAIFLMTLDRLPSWQDLLASLPEKHLHLMQPAGDAVMPWPGIFTGVLIVGIYFWCTNQFVIQRALGARSLDHGRWGSIFAGFLKLPNLYILILPGVMATALYPDLDRPDLVFPLLAFDVLPVGFRGLILAALAAAILSSLEAIYNSAATLFTMDFVSGFRPNLSQSALVRIGRVATMAFMVLSALWAPQITRFPTLWQYLQSILSYVTPPVVTVFLFGIFWSRGSPTAAFITLSVGITLGIAGWIGNEVAGMISIQYLYACGILFVVNSMMFVIVSIVKPASRPAETSGYRQIRQSLRSLLMASETQPWYRDYRVLSILLLTSALAIVVIWW
ncbi:hypothetical protein D3OALGA1CA_5695 [Olavius algarvensis associated proteobacterium Delta 3]|nr:hypothetical protein D3OALGA1CA_5695 [Olavius algarvensis associated proteobacterium Delta 3]